MRKEQKTALVAEITEGLGRASIALVSEYRGMTAGEATEVRRKIRAVQGELRVAKNTLIRRAVKDTAYSMLDDQLGGPVGLILSFADPVELAKTVTGMRELGEKFKVRGGVLDGKPLTAEEIQALAALPPREVVLGAVAWASAWRRRRKWCGCSTSRVRLLARVVDAIGKKEWRPGARGRQRSAANCGTTGQPKLRQPMRLPATRRRPIRRRAKTEPRQAGRIEAARTEENGRDSDRHRKVKKRLPGEALPQKTSLPAAAGDEIK